MTTAWTVVSTVVGTIWSNVNGTSPGFVAAVWDDGTPKWDLNGNVIESLWDVTV
jgi:hypothetical protein